MEGGVGAARTSGGAVGPEPVIRPMTIRDLSGVMAIERAAFSSPWNLATFAGLLRRDQTRLWVAEVGGDVVGYAVVWVVVDQAELGNLAISPAWRRRGLGSRLLGLVLDAMRDEGVRELFLEVRVSNVDAQRLYARHEFRQVGRRPGYYSSPSEDALVLRRLIETAPG